MNCIGKMNFQTIGARETRLERCTPLQHTYFRNPWSADLHISLVLTPNRCLANGLPLLFVAIPAFRHHVTLVIGRKFYTLIYTIYRTQNSMGEKKLFISSHIITTGVWIPYCRTPRPPSTVLTGIYFRTNNGLKLNKLENKGPNKLYIGRDILISQ
jgi:hypothetical protein